ncbi:hypothetical protein CMI37_10835 [Candidatus Pacearchaeota archaeon]|nr:hypothetical protein [Candidatus Pacearchaeota archaeon]
MEKEMREREEVEKQGVEKGVEKGVERISENERTIINLIKNDPYISKSEMIIKGKLTKKSIEWNIEKLKQRGLLKRVGFARGGYWEVVK